MKRELLDRIVSLRLTQDEFVRLLAVAELNQASVGWVIRRAIDMSFNPQIRRPRRRKVA